jgi:hypothetical protein
MLQASNTTTTTSSTPSTKIVDQHPTTPKDKGFPRHAPLYLPESHVGQQQRVTMNIAVTFHRSKTTTTAIVASIHLLLATLAVVALTRLSERAEIVPLYSATISLSLGTKPKRTVDPKENIAAFSVGPTFEPKFPTYVPPRYRTLLSLLQTVPALPPCTTLQPLLLAYSKLNRGGSWQANSALACPPIHDDRSLSSSRYHSFGDRSLSSP